MADSSHWTDSITNSTLCGYFYIFFLLFAFFAVLSILSAVYMLSTTKLTGGLVLTLLFAKLISFGISGTAALFLYLICERALKPVPARAASAPGMLL